MIANHNWTLFIRDKLRIFVAYMRLFFRYTRLYIPNELIHNILFSHWTFSHFRRAALDPEKLLVKLLPENDPNSKRDQSINLRVALAMAPTAYRFGIEMESELFFAYHSSLKALNSYSTLIDPRVSPKLLDYHRELALNQIREEAISCLVIQGESKFSDSSIFSESFIHLLRKLGIAIIVDLVDCFVTRNGQNVVNYFGNFADFVILHNSRLSPPPGLSLKTLYWPSLPYSEQYFLDKKQDKVIDLLIPGSQHRQRELYARKAQKSGISCSTRIFSSNNPQSAKFSYSDYVDSLCQSRILFTNGYKNRRESQVIGRVTEAMLSNCALLYETGSDIDYFFEKYKDYVPVRNLSDFIDKAFFLLNNPIVAQSISSHAMNTMLQSYSIRKFWQQIKSAVC